MIHSRIMRVIIITGLFAVAGCSSVNKVRIHVFDKVDNVPIQGAPVDVQRVTGEFANPFRTKSEVWQTGFTNSEGVYVAEFAVKHEYEITVNIKNYRTYKKSLLPHSQEVIAGDIKILVLPAYITDEN